MRTVFGILFAVLSIAWTSATLAEDSPAVCVQQYLADAGYAVGAIDGKLGPRTIGLAADFAKAHPELVLPALSRTNAAEWCEILTSAANEPTLPMGDVSIYAPGEADNLPEGAIAPGGGVPPDIFSGFTSVGRSTVSNAKAYGLAVVADPAGGTDTALRFEVRPGDCGQEQGGGFDLCEHGQEGVVVYTDTIMEDGEHYTLAFKIYIEGPAWKYSSGAAVLTEFGQPEFDDRLQMTSNGLQFQKGNSPPSLIALAMDVYDRWLEFEIDVVWSSDDDGAMSLTLDGVQKLDYHGVTLTEGEARVSFGIRRNGFKDQTSIAYFKNVVLTLVE